MTCTCETTGTCQACEPQRTAHQQPLFELLTIPPAELWRAAADYAVTMEEAAASMRWLPIENVPTGGRL